MLLLQQSRQGRRGPPLPGQGTGVQEGFPVRFRQLQKEGEGFPFFQQEAEGLPGVFL